MSSRAKFPKTGNGRRGASVISGTITIGSTGAVTSYDSECAVATKVGATTGRYLITLDKTYKKVRLLGSPGIVGPASAAFGNTDASRGQYRNLTTTVASTFHIQLMNATGTDTDAASGYVIHWAAEVQEY